MLAASTAPVAAATEPAKTWEKAQTLLHFHADQTEERACAFETEDHSLIECGGLIDSFDGLSLSVRIQMPKHAEGPLPTLLYLSSGGRGEFFADGDFPPDFNSESFARRGYVVISYSPRGFVGSCGTVAGTGIHVEDQLRPQPENPHGPHDLNGKETDCSNRGWTHVAERDFETRDAQCMLDRLVQQGVADPHRLAAAGQSLGAGSTWLLATSLPWDTTCDIDFTTIQLAAAVPLAGWTSLQNALTPNGRATDDADGGRSLERPYGILKQSSATGQALGGRVVARFNDVDSSETHSFTRGWQAFWANGEPYDTPEGATLAAAFRNKSAFFAEPYFDALRAGTVKPVPVLAVQGWNDALFPPVETLQMYRKLRASDARYPIYLFLGDVGHSTGPGVWTAVSAQHHGAMRDFAYGFLDAFVLRGGAGAPDDRIVSLSTECPAPSSDEVAKSDEAAGATWDSLQPGLISRSITSSATTRSGPPNLGEEEPTDPIVHGPGCITQAPGSYDSQAAEDYEWEVPGDFTLLGLPTVRADYQLSGVDATVVAKLWDVDREGTRTLVTRGMYRLTRKPGDSAAGTLRFQLFGNHYRFADDHKIQLELSQTDYSYLRPDSLGSAITYSQIKLELPTR